MQLFYSPDFSLDQPFLDAQEAKHCIRVLRKKDGDIIYITNGKGELFWGKVNIIGKTIHLSEIELKREEKNRDYYLHIAIAPTKNMDRLEWFLEKAVEIGIDEISLFVSDNSERQKLRQDRVEKTVVSALKQSNQFHLPILNELISLSKFMEKDFSEYDQWIGHCSSNFSKEKLREKSEKKKILILIGPEGDFSEKEIETAYSKGFKGLDLSNNRLRTETAGISICQNIQFIHYDS
jgi:16S rRNA (uracil1498-N3)-methyltransferase